jgi:hypothetical protein
MIVEHFRTQYLFQELPGRYLKFIAWFFVSIILLSPFVYILLFRPAEEFWGNIFGNLFATSLALIAGVPVGLWVDRYIKDAENKKLEKLNRVRELEILKLVKEELHFALNSNFIPYRKGKTNKVQSMPYKVELWDTLSASEQIKYIDSPELLNRIASAYYVIKSVRYIETEAYIASHTSAMTRTKADGSSESAAQGLINSARTFDGLFESSLREALKEIEKRIKQLN